MKKHILILTLLFFTYFLSAAALQPETKKFHPQLNIGFGIDFTGNPGTQKLFLSNKFGFTAGLDLKWNLSQQTDRGLSLGFGFDFQYWVPTSVIYEPDGEYILSSGYKYYQWLFIEMHYIRIPLQLKISYAFKVNADVLSHIEPEISIGINNNFIFFDYNSDDPDDDREMKEDFDENIKHWKLSGTWAIGINFLFENNWLLRTSIGGDFGSRNPKSELFYNPYYRMEKGERGYLTYILYGHHEFIMFETGYRF